MKFLKLKRILFSSSIIILIFFSSFFISCSSHSIGEFQNNAAEPPYRLFNILDDYPAVLSAFKNLDQAEFNRKMAEAVNADIDAAKDIFPLMGELSNDGTHHSKDLIDDIRHLVDLIRSQDTSDLDLPPVSTNYTDNSTAYLTDFYSFLDGIGNARTGVSGDLVPIVGKMTSYLTTRPDIETEVTDLIASLRESDSGSDGQSLSYLLKLLQEPLKKMLITTNENIWLNGTTVVADRASIDTGAHTNTGLGNAVRGLDALLSGLNDILSGDAEARNDLYAVITEFGAALDPAKGDTADMLKSLICEIEDRFTVGGAKFNGDYYTNDDDTYVNAELGNALKELWPPLQQLIIRSDTLTANGFKSIGYDAEGRSPLQVFVEALGKLDVDLSSYEIDDTLFKMVWYDGKGRPRFDHGGVSADPAASNISYLEQVLYTMVCAASFGYKDGGVTEEEYYNHNSTTGEVTAVNNGNYGNASHGHGEPTGGYLTLNDTMFNMTVPKLLEGMDIYGSYLDYNSSSYSYVNQVGQYVYRGKEGFTYDESLAAGTNGPADRFFLNSNYPANLMLSGLCVGDAGIPNGGRNLITAQKYNDEEVVYWPADSAGIGELNTARWMIGWIARAVWAGEGPYYHAASNAETAVIQGKTFYKYLRPNGAVYAYVHKPDPSDAATWEYIYPSDGAGDDQNPVAELVVRPTCAEFAGTRDFTNDISLSAGDDWTFRIKLGNSVDTTVTFSGGDTVSRSELIDAINSAVGSTVCFENDDYDHDGDGDLVSSTSRIQSILIRSTIGPILLESLGDRNALRELITDGGNLWTGTIPVYSAPAKGAIRQDKTFSTVSQPAVFNLKVDNSIDVDITIPAGDYSGDDIIAACVGQEASLAPYLIANGNGFKIRGSSNDIGSAKLIITAISGDGLAEIFGVSGSSIIRYLGRGNRYKESWHTDFYMSKVNHGNYTPEQWSRADETDSGSKEAGCVWYAEKLPEYSATRECATQEETLYRNFQWVLNEKKLVYVIPVVTLSPKIVMFLKIEGNGVRGLASAKKLKKPEDYAGDYDANNCWSIKKNGSDLYDGESFEPGDSRIDCYIPHYVNENINEQAVYTGIVGENYLLPDVVGANIAPVTRMGFFRQDAESISSTDAGPSGPYWSDRNRLLPVIIALLGSLRDQTRYEAASSGNDYNYAGTHYYPLRTATDSLMPALAKPMFYFQKDSGTDPAKYPPDNCWKPRLGGANDYLLPAMFLTENDRDSYYLPKENRSLMSLLSENEYKEGNGLIPRLAQTKMTSGLLGMLQSMGKSDALYNDSSGYTANNYSTWGARRKVFYGLEQLLTTLRSSEGEACANAYITLDSYPSWLYTDGVTNFRPAEDMQLDNLIEELVGFDDADFDGEGVPATVGKGLAAFPDRRETGTDSNTHFGYTWDGFSDSVELITELMRPGSEYCITGNLTNMLDSLFTGYKASDAELRSLRHTLGIILVSKIAYSSGDENPLKKMLTERVPTVLEEFQGHYANLLSLGKGLLQEDGLVAYMMSNLHSDFTAEETIDQLYDFLGSDIMYDPDSYLGGLFWADMEDLMTQMAGAMSSGSGEVNFYGDFGEVFEQ